MKVSEIELGHYHTKKINGIKELGDSTQVATISDDGYFIIWEATNGQYLAREELGLPQTTLEVNS
jgi:WD40 repeat protein